MEALSKAHLLKICILPQICHGVCNTDNCGCSSGIINYLQKYHIQYWCYLEKHDSLTFTIILAQIHLYKKKVEYKTCVCFGEIPFMSWDLIYQGLAQMRHIFRSTQKVDQQGEHMTKK